MEISRQEAVRTIEQFISGEGAAWDWDDFISRNHADSLVEAVKQRCANLREDFPPERPTEYCSKEGFKVLAELAKQSSGA
jgi:hypothetical protein